MSISLNPEKFNPHYPHPNAKKVNLYLEIFTEEIEKIKFSYSIMLKKSESGLSQNERMIFLNHSSRLGYANVPNQIQELPYMKREKLPKLKCVVKLSEIIKVENSKKVLRIEFFEGKTRDYWEFEFETSEMTLSWAKLILLSINANKIKLLEKEKGQKVSIRQKIFENLGDCPTSKENDETKLIVFDEKREKKNDTNVDKENEEFSSNEEKGSEEERKEKEENEKYFEYPNLEYQSDEQIQYEKDTLWAELQVYKNKCQQYEKKVEELNKIMRNTEMSKDEEIKNLKRRIEVLENEKLKEGNKLI